MMFEHVIGETDSVDPERGRCLRVGIAAVDHARADSVSAKAEPAHDLLRAAAAADNMHAYALPGTWIRHALCRRNIDLARDRIGVHAHVATEYPLEQVLAQDFRRRAVSR